MSSMSTKVDEALIRLINLNETLREQIEKILKDANTVRQSTEASIASVEQRYQNDQSVALLVSNFRQLLSSFTMYVEINRTCHETHAESIKLIRDAMSSVN